MNFEQLAAQYAPMISKVLRTAKIYKNHEFYRSCAHIGLWQASKRFDPKKGDFNAFAFHTMLTTVYTEMAKENKYNDRVIAFDQDELNTLAKDESVLDEEKEDLENIRGKLDMLTDKEFDLLVDLYVHQYSYDELAVKYNASKAALKKRRDRMIKKVREAKSALCEW